MPELPDIEVYLDALRERIEGRVLLRVRLGSPFLLRSVDPPIASVEGLAVTGLRRVGKRIVLELEADLYLVLHLMIAGRLRWNHPGAKLPRKLGLAAFDFDNGSLIVTEASKKKRASLYLVHGEQRLAEHDPGGIDPLTCSPQEFVDALRRHTHTLKRALTDPRILSGVGNAYSDEILHAAKLSPFKRTDKLGDDELERLHAACVGVMRGWLARLREERADGFPAQVTAFREGMAVHGRYGEPCPVCASPVQRIVYAANEANYCATCQTEGKLLADRALSRLLRRDWPRSLEELEQRKQRSR
ncbi:MAG: formamidopyrimidine-DNA glycosylase [Acidobacteria bacterium]|nr:formamidopyrimidine-DNA glycosylase [Acidobacteriota bacterium]NIM62313.1 formamidopyrimidine-DNA glycosylase [Acidobacteriota bacterium]NIO58254.1 formamidopyrimidine-DNA glycosylase [Acidobacteriota bacterium]NIQ29283.1 formamidopyrimidine-DNA glycosylase [Acidobacteriota bacterium]NIQ83882.1 formamidopyrimidine-DNA glycosylase [Acidobacteriota bacterium]